MVFDPTYGQGTPLIDSNLEWRKRQEKEQKERDEEDRIKCINSGGTWDETTKTCNLPGFKKQKDPTKISLPDTPGKKPQKVEPKIPETFTDPRTGRTSGITLPEGRTFLGVSPADVEAITRGEQERVARPEGTAPVGTAQRQADILFQGQQLAGGVGQFGQLGISPTGLDYREAFTTAAISSVPSAMRLGATAGLGIGALGGTAVFPVVGTTIGATLGAAIGAGVGFVAGIVGGMTSNFKSQRTDTTTAQQRVLDEGKQTLMDWVTLARADPANKTFYLGQYNQQLALIDQALRQMKLDTSEDVYKFETALPNLAEFESFYSVGGERDALNLEMRNALTSVSPENYNFLELSQRRGAI